MTSLAAVCARCGRVVVRSKEPREGFRAQLQMGSQTLQVPGQGTVCKIFEQGKVTYLGPSDVPHGGEFLELALPHGIDVLAGPGSTIRVEGLGRLMREVEAGMAW